MTLGGRRRSGSTGREIQAEIWGPGGSRGGQACGALRASCSQKKAVGLPCPPVVTGRQVQSQAPSQCPRPGLTGFSALRTELPLPPTRPSIHASVPHQPHPHPYTGTAATTRLGVLQQLWEVSPGQAILWTQRGEVVAPGGAWLRGPQTSSGISCDLSLTLSLAAPFLPEQSPVSGQTSTANQRGILFLLYSQTKTLI